MTKLFALSGSLRKGSYNSALLRAAQALAIPDLTIEIGTIAGVPLYDDDARLASGIPDSVKALKDGLAAADGLLLATPEYNYGVPGVLKNAIDWMSRPPADIDRVFDGKAAGIVGASTGGGGTRFAQVAWLPTLKGLGLHIHNGDWFAMGGAAKMFDAEGVLTDEASKKYLREYVEGLATFAAALKKGR